MNLNSDIIIGLLIGSFLSQEPLFKFPTRGNLNSTSIYHMILRIIFNPYKNILFSMSGKDFLEYFQNCYFFVDGEPFLRQGYIQCKICGIYKISETNNNHQNNLVFFEDDKLVKQKLPLQEEKFEYDEHTFENMQVYVSFYFTRRPLRSSFYNSCEDAHTMSENNDMIIYRFTEIKLLIDELFQDNHKINFIFMNFEKLAKKQLDESFGKISNNSITIQEQIEMLFYDPIQNYEFDFNRDGNLITYMENTPEDLRYITEHVYTPLLQDVYPYTDELLSYFTA